MGRRRRRSKSKSRSRSKSRDILIVDPQLVALIQEQNLKQQQQQAGDLREEDSRGRKMMQMNKKRGPNKNKTATDPILERQKLTENIDKTMRGIAILSGRCGSLDLKIKQVQERIIEEKKRKKSLGGVEASREQRKKYSTKAQVLSQKLDRVLKMCSKVEHTNLGLTRGINEKRKERLIFEQLQAQLQKEFRDKQLEMAKLLEKSNEHNECMLKAKAEIKNLIDLDAQEREQHNKEYDVLGAIIRKQEEKQNELQTASLKRRMNQIQQKLGNGSLDPEEEAKLKARLQNLTSKIERKVNEIEQTKKEKIWSYEEAFQRIITEISKAKGKPMNLTEIVEQYVQNYDESFALLNYVQRLQDENFQLEKQLHYTTSEKNKYLREQGKQDKNKERIKNELEHTLQTLQKHNEHSQNILERQENNLKQIISRVQSIAKRFNVITPTNKVIDEDVTLKTLMAVLGEIELGTIQLCKVLHKLSSANVKNSRPTNETNIFTSSSSGFNLPSQRQSSAMIIGDPNSKQGNSLNSLLPGGPEIPIRTREQSQIMIEEISPQQIQKLFETEAPQHTLQEEDEPIQILSPDQLREIVNLKKN